MPFIIYRATYHVFKTSYTYFSAIDKVPESKQKKGSQTCSKYQWRKGKGLTAEQKENQWMRPTISDSVFLFSEIFSQKAAIPILWIVPVVKTRIVHSALDIFSR